MSRPPDHAGVAARVVRYAVGIGARPGVDADAVRSLVGRVLAEHGLDPRAAVFATIASRADEPGLREALRAIVEDTCRPEETPAPGGARRAAPAAAMPVVGAASGVTPGGMVAWQPHELAEETVPNPSGRVVEAVGTPGVAEAAALRTARMLPGAVGAELVVPKTAAGSVTVSVARPLLDESM
jgi:cobalamin biosynthesis protein CbiG